MKKLSKLTALMLSAALCIGMAAPALAVEYDIADGAVHVENDADNGVYSYQSKAEGDTDRVYTSDDPDIIITGSYTEEDKSADGSRIDIGENVTDTTITLENVSVDASKAGEAALSIGAGSDVTIELSGTNELKSGDSHAGLELNGGASVTIQDAGTGADETEDMPRASLKAEGVGFGGADIGSRNNGEAGNITITGNVNVTAKGSNAGAGIGSGYSGKAGNIVISGNAAVTAYATDGAAAIGSGYYGTVGNITITDNAIVSAKSEYGGGAGIGSSYEGKAGDITISGNANVTAAGAYNGAGIGSGWDGEAGSIKISENAKVTATKGNSFNSIDGIGDGKDGKSKDIDVRFMEGDTLHYIHRPEGGTRYEYTVTPPEGAQLEVDTTDFTKDIIVPVGSTGTKDGKPVEMRDGGTISVENGFVPGAHDYQLTVTKPATCTEDGEQAQVCVNCGDQKDAAVIPATSHSYTEVTRPATCTEDGSTAYTCSKCGDSYEETIPTTGHTPVVDPAVEPTETSTGLTEGSHCGVCGEVIVAQEEIPMLTPEEPDTPENPENPDTPENPEIPVIPGGDTDSGSYTPATIEDQEVPLAGLMPVAQLLEALRQYEEIEDMELPEDFKWIDHEYAQAIYWGLQEELVADTEEQPFDPDEVVTVALLRGVLVNFVEVYLGLEDFAFTIEGEDDELVFDLGDRLAAFYGELEAFLKDQAA